MRLSEIWIYPVKSLGGIRLTEANVEERGLQYDRRWLIIDENNVFITQRVFGQMALIDVALESSGLKIFLRNNPKNNVILPYEPGSGKKVSVTIWDDIVNAVTVSDEADAWLSAQLDKRVRLVMMPESTERKADPKYASNGENVSFADGFPFLVISQASLDELNSRLEEPISMVRFRPNFVIAETMPFEEDQWKRIRVGELDFEIVKPCGRCVLITVDPATGEKGAEPLKTLASYRRVNNKVLFGQNMVASNFGLVKEGDALEVVE
ncbi:MULTISPECIES: MOSC domain-containing protein [Dyadobacter]|uniref:MOSC domain-containing protein n=1 Tax=Dyadobacter chenhuakuii TaxID=2909339 RepID=A0ABY4XKU2_9BACT|nr:MULTISPECIES: MOSC N-terminal beta barrel domain-containing protein [Dyadobacter]MCF2493461.1 MOSC domain-containing protein [Dyadobacter chenhuakuii]MCF2519305.1 MOSC domain-containing protein [Dyadobacter sp. CY351]USJ30602.1 MOSC domain-containing protein [Dyadobacter chenhuakuii]